MLPTNEYWMLVVGTLFAFLYAFAIGANDAANSFAPSVASKSLSLRNAIILAMIFEFSGALVGANSLGTVKGKVFNPKIFKNDPYVAMLGMVCSLITGSFVLLLATWFSLPISTTHVIVGSILGFTIKAKGWNSVDWAQTNNVFLSWAVSPLVSGAAAFFFFMIIRCFVLESHNPFHRAFLTFPFVLIIGVAINIFYILYKGLSNLSFSSQVDVSWCLPVSLGIGTVLGLIWLTWVGPWEKRRVIRKIRMQPKGSRADDDPLKSAEEAQGGTHSSEGAGTSEDPMNESRSADNPRGESEPPDSSPEPKASQEGVCEAMGKIFVANTFGQDLRSQSMEENKQAREIWARARKYDAAAELLFTSLQVFTSCVNSFAHGANDVSNSISPLSALYQLYNDGALGSKANVYTWMHIYGGAGIAIGALLFGYRVMKSIGFKISMSSPSRATAAVLASSLGIIAANFASIPVSTTQCITGAVTGVGLANGIRDVNWLYVFMIVFSWVGTFLASALLNAGVYALFAYCLQV